MRGLPTYQTNPSAMAKATGAGVAVALLVGVLWGYGPQWGFYLSLVLGFGVAEAMAWASRGKRGRDLQVIGWLIVAFGLLLSRVVLAQRLGIGWTEVNALAPWVEDVLYIRIIPDGLFAALPFAIVWYRFR